LKVPTGNEQLLAKRVHRANPTVSERRLPADPSQLSTARKYAMRAAVAFGLGGDGCYDFVFAVNEAVTNAIRHGVPDSRGQIHLSTAVDDADRLTFTVRDCGTFVPTLNSAPRSEHGRGFLLMVSLVDEVQLCIRPRSTTVRLFKARPLTTQAHPAITRAPVARRTPTEDGD
jgi:anti-sigma regulatory factor (Ser/Thr protein kinase)